ncbi:MAG: CBS domain-containing protein, partial [Candidatus Dadabacteria bacterium]
MAQAIRGKLLERQFLDRKVKDLECDSPPVAYPDYSAGEVVKILKDNKVGGVVVIDKTNLVQGIFTERDAVRWFGAVGSGYLEKPISDIMTREPEVIKEYASIARAMYMMAKGGYRHLPVVDNGGKFSGLLLAKDFIDFIHKAFTKDLKVNFGIVVADNSAVSNFLASPLQILKPASPVTVSEESVLSEVLRKMGSEGIDCVVVVNEEGKITGIFSSRDYILKVSDACLECDTVKISEVMTEKPKTSGVGNKVAFAFNMMSKGGYRHIPLTNIQNEPVG